MKEGHWTDVTLLVCHLAYSVVLLALVGPIFRVHLGLMIRVLEIYTTTARRCSPALLASPGAQR